MKSRVNVITSLLILAAFLTISHSNIIFGIGPTPLPPPPPALEISPDKISHQEDLPDATITFELPKDIGLGTDDIPDANLTIDDITDANLIIEFSDSIKDIEIEAKLQDVTETNGNLRITAVFDLNKLMGNLPDDYYGKLNVGVACKLETGVSLGVYGGSITVVQASDYISEINFDQIWDYGDPTDTTDLMYEFRLEVYSYGTYYDGYSYVNRAEIMDADIVSIEFLTPAGQTFEVPKKSDDWSNPVEYKARFEDSADLLQAYGDGEYTITLHLGDGIQVQTKAWFGNPYINQPIPQPTQEPVLASELQQQMLGSLVTFNWGPCDDQNVDDIYIKVLGTFNNWLGDKWQDLDFNQTSWGPVLLLDGSWEAELVFSTLRTWDLHWKNDNEDGISVGVAKSSRNRYRITVEDSPWNIYEVWGGNEELSWSDYLYIDKLEAYGYEKLDQSDGNKKFPGQFDYYLIATMGQCFIESIQGSDRLFYNLDEVDKSNISDEDNLSGDPDEQCAILGSGRSGNNYGYNGYFVFADPNNWKTLTVFTCDRNLNLDKSILSVNDEIENINPNDIDPNDIITYRISFDSNDFPQDVKDANDANDVKNVKNVINTVHNIKVVDILSDHVSFLSAFPPDSNEVTGSYDPVAHTYTWQYPTLAPQTPIGHRLTVRVNPDTLPGTTISNFVTIDSDETPPSIARIDAAIPYEPLNITKSTIDSAGNEIDWIESGKEFIYQICFDNNNNGPQVGDVNLVDLLPFEVTYVDYQSDNPNFSGSYDANDHSFKGKLDTLEPGRVTCLKITVEVNEDTPNIIINNAVAIDSNETPDANDIIAIEVIPPLEVADVIITPDILSRAGTPQHITAVVKFPAGIQQSEIDPANIPQLYYQDRDTGDFILIGNGSRPVLSGTQITTLFNRAELMDAIYGYGEFTLAVVGQLKSSLTFYGYANIHISKFTGN